jgi:hypothetical protein
MLTPPRWLLHLEAAAIFALFLFLYRLGHFGWGWHALIWVSHIGFDRRLGYGLKYPTPFRDTHSQHV